MELLIDRTKGVKTRLSTLSSFYVNGIFESYCLEPTDRGLTSAMGPAQIAAIKIPGKTAMPTGRYRMDWYFSPGHGIWLPRVLNVPGFEDDEIHIGNFPKDTKGCILLGTAKAPDELLNSKTAINNFYPKFKAAIQKEEVFITIK